MARRQRSQGAQGKPAGKPKRGSGKRALDAFRLAEQQTADHSLSEEEYEERASAFRNGTVLDARHINGEAEGDLEEQFEDEELDSDEALGLDDDYDVFLLKMSQTIRDRRGAAPEESDGEASVDESEFVPLWEAWDRDDADMQRQGEDVVLDDKWESESEDGSDDSESESESDAASASDSEAYSSDASDASLTSVVAKLPGLEQTKAHKTLTAAGTENEYLVPTSGLLVADMMLSVDASVAQSTFLVKDNAPAPAAVPLPKRIQERGERRAAYELSKDEVAKWEDTVKQNRRAEVLKFPLGNPEPEAAPVLAFTPASAATELEKQVEGVLRALSLLDELKIKQFEDLATAHVPAEELKRRQNELRQMRELMFREEQRAKRIKKIKLKAYHKIKKRQRLREEQLVDELEDDEDAETARATERMLLRHRNANSAWAKKMVRSGLLKDKDNREELEEMMRQGERLRMKQMGEEEEAAAAQNDMSSLLEEEDEPLVGKGVMQMDFMKKAAAKERADNKRTLELLKELEESGDVAQFEEKASAVEQFQNQGRRVYSAASSDAKDAVDKHNQEVLQEHAVDESKSLVNRLSKRKGLSAEPVAETNEEAATANPWLGGSATKARSKVTVVDANSSKAERQAAKMSRKRTADEAPEAAISLDQTLTLKDGHEESDQEFEQQTLIAEAFAGDDVVAEFEAEKAAVVEEEGDKEEDNTLPGWGSWGGGNAKPKKRKVVKKIDGVVQAEKRRDKKLANVVINERVNKRNLKYQLAAVPHGFDTSEQYERLLRMPIGQEWTLKETHQKLTMPRVVVKPGQVIAPLSKPNK